MIVNGFGTWPVDLEHVALADRMRVSYRELEDTPVRIVDDYRTVMAAEAEAAEINARWGGRTS